MRASIVGEAMSIVVSAFVVIVTTAALTLNFSAAGLARFHEGTSSSTDNVPAASSTLPAPSDIQNAAVCSSSEPNPAWPPWPPAPPQLPELQPPPFPPPCPEGSTSTLMLIT